MLRDDRSDVSWKAAGGGLVATIEDLSRYCHALIERKLTGAARDTQLWSPAPDNTYAHGFFRQPESGIIEHNGAQQGARSGLLIQPNAQRCFLVMTNSEAGNGTTWVRAMAERW